MEKKKVFKGLGGKGSRFNPSVWEGKKVGNYRLDPAMRVAAKSDNGKEERGELSRSGD